MRSLVHIIFRRRRTASGGALGFFGIRQRNGDAIQLRDGDYIFERN